MTVTAGSAPDTFVTVPGDRHSEVARTLAEPVPRALSAFDHTAVVIVLAYLARGHWDLSPRAPARWLMLLPWAAGFVTYQLINPDYVSWWASVWTRVAQAIGFTPAAWMSASICSFAVAAAVTLAAGGLACAARKRSGRAGQPATAAGTQ